MRKMTNKASRLAALSAAVPFIGAVAAVILTLNTTFAVGQDDTPASTQSQTSAASTQLFLGGWVPGNSAFFPFQYPLGDMWMFKCPKNGTVNFIVDTRADQSDGHSNIDPAIRVIDNNGFEVNPVAGNGDEDWSCTAAPRCGYSCPNASYYCGNGGKFYLEVYDYAGNDTCSGGGGYTLEVVLFDKNLNPKPASKIAIGGGFQRDLPGWTKINGVQRPQVHAPILDDEELPFPIH